MSKFHIFEVWFWMRGAQALASSHSSMTEKNALAEAVATAKGLAADTQIERVDVCKRDEVTIRFQVRRVSCGCCTNGCVCWNHQDTPNGRPPQLCDIHHLNA